MRAAGYDVREIDPFEDRIAFSVAERAPSPYVTRMQLDWQSMRSVVVEGFPKPPGRPKDKSAYLSSMDDVYVDDAYHSLSIEGYRVSRAPQEGQTV